MSATDDELMYKIAQGDRKSFAILFDRHGGKILGYAKRILGDAAQAEDVTQEIWMKVIQLSPNYKGQGQFISWTLTMTRHRCFNKLRDSKRLTFDDTAVDEATDNVNIEQTLIDRSDEKRLKRAIDQLPDLQRAALTALLAENLSYEELAAQLNTTVASVKSLLFRARKNLELEYEKLD